MSEDFVMPVTQLLTVRNLLRGVRTPLLIAISLAQPALWLILFSQTFRALADTPQFRALGYGSYLSFFLPGMVVLSMLFTALQSGMATMSDIDTGMLDKLLTAPVSRWSILAARVLADAVVMTVQAIVLIALGAAMGARLRAGWPGWLLFGVLAVAFGVVWASVSNLVALRTRNSEVTMVLGFFLTLPVLLAATLSLLPAMGGGPPAAATALAAARTDPGLATQLAPVVNAPDGATVTVMTITPREAFDSAQATSLVADLRRELPAELRGTGLQALVGGATSEISDLTSEINSKTPLALVLIVGMALLLLAAAYCSPLIALTGLAGTMLSVGAAYGLVVIAFQKGAGQSLFGLQSPGFTQDYLPLSLFAVLTGLSTDYQVFLISRIKEEWERSHDAARAVSTGLERSGRVILSAATIMVIVFASFLLATRVDLKELGFALAVVVLIDAAIARRLLVPAALRLLGDTAWTWPARRRPRPPLPDATSSAAVLRPTSCPPARLRPRSWWVSRMMPRRGPLTRTGNGS